MRTFRTILILISLTIGLSACASVRTQSSFDQGVNFAAYKSYAWLPAFRWRQSWFQQRMSPIDEHIRQFVREDLNAKGLREAAGGKPDIWVVYYAGINEPVDVATLDYKPWWGEQPPPGMNGGPYNRGTLVLDVIDAKSDSLIWRGSAPGALRTPDEDPKRVDKALTDLLAGFPPASPSSEADKQ